MTTPEPLTPEEAETVLNHMARSLEMSAHPRPDQFDRAVIEKLKVIVGPKRWAECERDFFL